MASRNSFRRGLLMFAIGAVFGACIAVPLVRLADAYQKAGAVADSLAQTLVVTASLPAAFRVPPPRADPAVAATSSSFGSPRPVAVAAAALRSQPAPVALASRNVPRNVALKEIAAAAAFQRFLASTTYESPALQGPHCCRGGRDNKRCPSQCWWTQPLVQLDRAAFLALPLTESCCATKDGGVPLGLTLRKRVFAQKRGGFFIESGGQDGLFQTNTIVAERVYGWKGLLIEPSAALAPLCKARREPPNGRSTCVTAALTSYGGDSFVSDPGGAPGGQIGLYHDAAVAAKAFLAIHAYPISVILAQHNVTSVDLWSLDIEGFELPALKGLNWTNAAHRPMWVMIEVRPTHHAVEIFAHMKNAGYALTPGLNGRKDISGWAHKTAHRDYLWRDTGSIPSFATAERLGLMRIEQKTLETSASWARGQT